MKLYIVFEATNKIGSIEITCDYEELGANEIKEIQKHVGEK